MAKIVELLTRPIKGGDTTHQKFHVGEHASAIDKTFYDLLVDGAAIPKGTKISRRDGALHFVFPDNTTFDIVDWCGVTESKFSDLIGAMAFNQGTGKYEDLESLNSGACVIALANGGGNGALGEPSSVGFGGLLGGLALAAAAAGGGGSSAAVAAAVAAPSAKLAPSSATASDPNLTNSSHPGITGKGVAGEHISVKLPTGEVVNTVVDANGNWSVTPQTALPDGQVQALVTATSASGVVSATVLTVFTVDTTPPATPPAALAPVADSGVQGDALTNQNKPAIAGTGTPGDKITLTSPTGEVMTATVDATGQWTVTPTTALPEGTNHFTVTETDAAGNVSAPGALDIKVDTVASAVTAALSPAPASDSGLAGDNLTHINKPAIAGVTEPGLQVTVVVNGQRLTTTAAADGSWSVTPTAALPDGTYTPVVTVADAAGNVTTANATPFTVDTALPTVAGALTAAAGNDSGAIGDNLTNNATPAISGTTTPGSAVTIVVAGQTLRDTADASGNWSVNVLSALPDASYTPQLTITDPAGNTATGNGTPFTVYTALPAVAGALSAVAGNDSGTLGDNLTNNTTPAISGTTEPGSAVTVVVAGQTLHATADASGNWSVTVPTALADATYTPQLTITNPAGNTATGNGTAFTVDHTAPPLNAALAVSAPNDTGTLGDNLTATTAPVISGTTEAGAALSIIVNGQTYTTTADTSGNWSITSATLHDGTYTPTLTITDPAGNISSGNGTPFTVDAMPPAASGALLAIAGNDSGTLGDNLTNNNTPAIGGISQPGSAVSVTVNGATYTTTVDGTGHWSISTAMLPDGTYTPVISVIDPAGVSSTANGTPFAIATTALTVTGALTASAPNDSGALGDNITNINTPALSGTTEAGATVSVQVHGTTYTTTADAAGNWSLSTNTLADGTYAPVITATDPAGNTTTANGTSFTIDTSAPPASGALLATAANDSGALGDNTTNVAAPILSGITQAGATVSVLVNGSTYTTTADAAGDWSVTTATLPDGTYTPVIIASDLAGNSTTANGTAFTIDTTAPAVNGAMTATAPNDSGAIGDNITNNTTPAISGSTQPGATVSMVVAGITYTAVADISGHWSITTAALSDGTYTPALTITDQAGNITSANGTPFTVDSTQPPVNAALTAAAPNDSGALGDNITSVNSPAISGTTQPGSSVVLVINGASYSTSADSSGNWSVTTATLPDGTYTPSLTITDPAGNTATGSGTQLTIDTTAPAANAALTAIAANDSGVVGDNLTTLNTPEVSGTTQPGSAVSVVVNGVTYTTTADGAGHWSFNTSTLPDGTYTPVVTVTDLAGNTTTANGTPLNIDTTLPPVNGALLAVPSNDTGVLGDNLTRTSTPEIAGTTQAGSAVSVQVNGVTYTTTADSSGHWTITTATLADGTYTPTITITDQAGNVASGNGTPLTVSSTSSLINGALQAVAPNDSGMLGDNLTDNTTPTLDGTASAGSAVSVLVNGTTYNTTADASGNWYVTTAALADGSYTPFVTLTDTGGTTSSGNATPFTIDTTAPAISGALQALAPNDSGTIGDNITKVSTPVLSGVTEANLAVSVVVNGVTYNTTSDASGHWSVSTTTLPDGTYTPVLTTADAAGNTVTSNGTAFTVDTTAPAVGGALLATAPNDSGTLGDNLTKVTTPVLSGATQAGSNVSVVVNGVTYNTTANGSGVWSITTNALPDGTYTPVITATDPAGNVATGNGTPFTVDTAAPPVNGTLTATAPNDSGTLGDNLTNTVTPAISGTTLPGSAVTMVVNGSTYHATADALGNWSITTSTLPQGTYTPSLTIVDPAGVAASGSGTAFTIAATAPTLTTTLAGISKDNGTSVTDYTTGLGQAGGGVFGHISATLPNGDTVQVSTDGGASWHAAVVSGTNWGYVDPTTHNANWTLEARVVDAAGNAGATVSQLVTYNASTIAALTAQISSVTTTQNASTQVGNNAELYSIGPASSSYAVVTPDNIINTMTGTATANATVQIYEDTGALIGTTTANASGAWTLTGLSTNIGIDTTHHFYAVPLTGGQPGPASSPFNIAWDLNGTFGLSSSTAGYYEVYQGATGTTAPVYLSMVGAYTGTGLQANAVLFSADGAGNINRFYFDHLASSVTYTVWSVDLSGSTANYYDASGNLLGTQTLAQTTNIGAGSAATMSFTSPGAPIDHVIVVGNTSDGFGIENMHYTPVVGDPGGRLLSDSSYNNPGNSSDVLTVPVSGSLNATGGDDILNLSPTATTALQAGSVNLDGGSGNNTLVFTGASQNLNLSTVTGHGTFSTTGINNVDHFDINGTGANTLTISLNDVLHLGQTNAFVTDGRTQVMVSGGADDKVTLAGLTGFGTDPGAWAKVGTTVISGVTYDVYDHSAYLAEMLIQHGMTVA